MHSKVLVTVLSHWGHFSDTVKYIMWYVFSSQNFIRNQKKTFSIQIDAWNILKNDFKGNPSCFTRNMRNVWVFCEYHDDFTKRLAKNRVKALQKGVYLYSGGFIIDRMLLLFIRLRNLHFTATFLPQVLNLKSPLSARKTNIYQPYT